MPIVHNTVPPLHPHPRTPGVQMRRAAQLLQVHLHLLQTHAEAAYIIHRQDCGKPSNFLRSVNGLLRQKGTARWVAPWGRGATCNVLLVHAACVPLATD
jgi:hypothetical protein